MSEHVALVTGASRGIGAAVARQFVEQGIFVYGTATTEEGAKGIDAALGGEGSGLVVRIEDAASVEEMVKAIQENHDVDVIVNNAGITRDNLFMRMSESDWSDVINTNLSSLFHVVKPFIRNMLRTRWGRIINVGSVVGGLGNAGQANYVSAKAGMEGFTRSLALELGSRGITVNCVAPGFIDTDMTDGLADQAKEQLVERIPLGRIGTVDEVAAVVGFLASDSSSYISAQTIGVNGGMFPH